MIPHIIPRLHQPVSRSPVAPRHANALFTKAAQIAMALRHHERRVAARSAHTLESLEANMSHDTTNHPAHQRHTAFTPVCLALPSGTAPRKHTSHQGHATPNNITNVIWPHVLPIHYKRLARNVLQKSRKHFVRDFLQKSCFEAARRAFRTRLPPKVTRQVSKRAFRTRLPQ